MGFIHKGKVRVPNRHRKNSLACCPKRAEKILTIQREPSCSGLSDSQIH